MAIVYSPNMEELSLVKKILSLSDVAKRRIVRLLECSIADKDANVVDEKKCTEQMLRKFAGAWQGNESADEIMQHIRETSSIRIRICI